MFTLIHNTQNKMCEQDPHIKYVAFAKGGWYHTSEVWNMFINQGFKAIARDYMYHNGFITRQKAQRIILYHQFKDLYVLIKSDKADK